MKAPAMRLAAALATLTSAAADSDWWTQMSQMKDQVKESVQQMKDQVTAEHDVVGINELLQMTPVTAESCGSDSDLMQVKSVHFDAKKRAAVVRGSLLEPVTGGTVVAKIDRTELPEHAGIAHRVKSKMLWAVSGGKRIHEDLCTHLDRFSGKAYDSCPVPAGEEQELHFAFSKLPEMVMAGKYSIEFSSVDPVGNQIACVKGSLSISPSKEGHMFRKLEEDCDDCAVASAAVASTASFVTVLVAIVGFMYDKP